MCYNFIMNIDLSKYADSKICVAVSGGKDSMALLHYIYTHARAYGITLTALNCDHKIRGALSARDSEFVRSYCEGLQIPLLTFSEDCVRLAQTLGASVETAARNWRRECYVKAAHTFFSDAVATAHHLNDNAETVLFNLARGSAVAGAAGITDTVFNGVKFIRPFISRTRGEIDAYINENSVPYVEDETNLSDDYTRNRIRHSVLPELEKAVPAAAEGLYRFSRLAAEDEQYFAELIKKNALVVNTPYGVEIKLCTQAVVFRRAATYAVKSICARKDYTSEHMHTLYNLQFSENGKKFEFLGLTAYKENDKIVLTEAFGAPPDEIAYSGYAGAEFCAQPLKISSAPADGKVLMFDGAAVPQTAVIRFMREGDFFTKFGGGTKSLGDFFTDKKIPVRLRRIIPLIADGSEILAVCGVEISDRIKVTPETVQTLYVSCTDYTSL